MKYYVIGYEYVGPDDFRRARPGYIWISDHPVRDVSGKIVSEGYAGTVNGWMIWGYGRFPTVENARSAVLEGFYMIEELDVSLVEPGCVGVFYGFRKDDYYYAREKLSVDS